MLYILEVNCDKYTQKMLESTQQQTDEHKDTTLSHNRGSDNRIGAFGVCSKLILYSFHKGTEDTVSYFSFPSVSPPYTHLLLLRLHNCSRLYTLPSHEKETSACSGIHFLTMGPFVLVESGNGKERERKSEVERGREGEEGSLPR